MTDNQKKEVERLRKLGYGFGTISRQLGVPVDTIKSHCRRHSIQKEPEKVLYVHCLNCGKGLTQIPGRKRKSSARMHVVSRGGQGNLKKSDTRPGTNTLVRCVERYLRAIRKAKDSAAKNV